MVDLCRLCASLRKIDVLVSIKDESNEICEKLRKCCQLNIKLKDALPKSICQECLANLNKSHKFYVKVTEAQETLQALYPGTAARTQKETENDKESAQTSMLVQTLTAIKENTKKRKFSQLEQSEVKSLKIIETENPEIPLKQIKLEKCITAKANDSIKETKLDSSIKCRENFIKEVYDMLDMTKEESIIESSYEILETLEENSEDLTEESVQNYLNYEESSEQPESLIEEHHVLEDNCVSKSILAVSNEKQLETEQTEVLILPDKELNIEFEYMDNYIEDEEEDEELLANEDNEETVKAVMPLNSWKSYNYLCSICDNMFTNLLDLYTHLADEHQQTEIDKLHYKCYDCQKVIPRYNFFLNHIRSKHHPSLKLKCEICDLSCPNYEELSYHRSVNCPEANKYANIIPCNECFKSFHNPYGLQNHYKAQHTNIKYKSKYQCTECHKEFLYKSCLMVHEQIHTGKKKFACSYCDRTFSNKSSLELHLYTHIDEKIYKCNICNKSFKTFLSLDQHHVLHKEEKPFKCEFCDKDFRKKIQKIAHERTHTGEMPFSCTQCDKRFRFLSALNAHIKIHTGVKPYSCEYCDKTFADSSNRNKHIRRKHANSENKINTKV